ncbi:unnamed protein product [Heligmosomoides polygyrus]|uniref:Uncharacterized protein n=1 Tax=Heligmosomoides polygyrus TaxID=6339 RepID=A0A3P8CUJ4_HELPZ|nr:unnamed protein product [Heligmosomoides polygyrus]
MFATDDSVAACFTLTVRRKQYVNHVSRQGDRLSYIRLRRRLNHRCTITSHCLIPINLQKNAWHRFLDSTNTLDAVLFSVSSPQLDSKCYALEILLLLLEQPQGFVVLMRALTALAARTHDYVRFSLFVAQLKHGLHTNKLHIQVKNFSSKKHSLHFFFQGGIESCPMSAIVAPKPELYQTCGRIHERSRERSRLPAGSDRGGRQKIVFTNMPGSNASLPRRWREAPGLPALNRSGTPGSRQ